MAGTYNQRAREYLDDRQFLLTGIAHKLGVRLDWHEPDEQAVTAKVVGKTLDNAMGDSGECNEMVVVIEKDGKEVHRINLATLLAIATFGGRP